MGNRLLLKEDLDIEVIDSAADGDDATTGARFKPHDVLRIGPLTRVPTTAALH